MIEFQAFNWSNGIPIVEVLFVILFVKVFCNMNKAMNKDIFNHFKDIA